MIQDHFHRLFPDFLKVLFFPDLFSLNFFDHPNSLTFSSFPWPVGTQKNVFLRLVCRRTEHLRASSPLPWLTSESERTAWLFQTDSGQLTHKKFSIAGISPVNLQPRVFTVCLTSRLWLTLPSVYRQVPTAHDSRQRCADREILSPRQSANFDEGSAPLLCPQQKRNIGSAISPRPNWIGIVFCT